MYLPSVWKVLCQHDQDLLDVLRYHAILHHITNMKIHFKKKSPVLLQALQVESLGKAQ